MRHRPEPKGPTKRKRVAFDLTEPIPAKRTKGAVSPPQPSVDWVAASVTLGKLCHRVWIHLTQIRPPHKLWAFLKKVERTARPSRKPQGWGKRNQSGVSEDSLLDLALRSQPHTLAGETERPVALAHALAFLRTFGAREAAAPHGLAKLVRALTTAWHGPRPGLRSYQFSDVIHTTSIAETKCDDGPSCQETRDCLICYETCDQKALLRLCATCTDGWVCEGCFFRLAADQTDRGQTRTLWGNGRITCSSGSPEPRYKDEVSCPSCRKTLPTETVLAQPLVGCVVWTCEGCSTAVTANGSRLPWRKHLQLCPASQRVCTLGACSVKCAALPAPVVDLQRTSNHHHRVKSSWTKHRKSGSLPKPALNQEAVAWVDHARGNTCKSYTCQGYGPCSSEIFMVRDAFIKHQRLHELLDYLLPLLQQVVAEAVKTPNGSEEFYRHCKAFQEEVEFMVETWKPQSSCVSGLRHGTVPRRWHVAASRPRSVSFLGRSVAVFGARHRNQLLDVFHAVGATEPNFLASFLTDLMVVDQQA